LVEAKREVVIDLYDEFESSKGFELEEDEDLTNGNLTWATGELSRQMDDIKVSEISAMEMPSSLTDKIQVPAKSFTLENYGMSKETMALLSNSLDVNVSHAQALDEKNNETEINTSSEDPMKVFRK
jgi:hypothetical protein